MRITVATFFLACATSLSSAQASSQSASRLDVKLPQTSLMYSCLEAPFLSISVSTPRHNTFVDVALRVVDPQHRTAGYGANDHPIPKSSYGRVIEMPRHADVSKAVAVEICDAMEGKYELTVWEHSKAEYRVHVRGMDANHHFTDILYPIPEEGRVCRYMFQYRLDTDETIRWLDGQGRMLPFPEKPACTPVQRASLTQRPSPLTVSPRWVPLVTRNE